MLHNECRKIEQLSCDDESTLAIPLPLPSTIPTCLLEAGFDSVDLRANLDQARI
jgi:hypothetical protein